MDVTALGELLIDFTCIGGEGYPVMEAHPGGAPANFLAALAKFGAGTALISKVGEDAFGRLLVRTLKELGISTEGVTMDPEVFTTLAFVTLDDKGNRSFSFARKPGADTCLRPEEVQEALIRQAKVFHFGSLSLTHQPARSATVRAVALAKQLRKLITYDPNLRMPLWPDPETARQQLLWGMAQADVVKLSDEEADFLFGLPPMAAAEQILRQYPVKLVFVTCGPDGCVFANPVASGSVPGLSGVQAVDTTGAGDIFGGAAVWQLLQHKTPPEKLSREQLLQIARFAVAASGLSTERPGGIFSVPEPEQVLCALS